MTSLPAEMTRIAATAIGDADVLRPQRVPTPQPEAGELLVRVMAAGVNRADVLQRTGSYALPPGADPTPGLEVAGQVAALGDGVTSFAVGHLVCGLTNGGGYAEYCRVPAGLAFHWPPGYDAVQAAALPEALFTVWANLFQMGKVHRGETVLIHGGTSGIGTTAIRLLKAFGIRPLATAGSAEKCAALVKIGADLAINYRQQDFVAAVLAATFDRGVDAILDIVGAAYLERNMAALAQDGRLLIIGLQGGAVAERLDLRNVMAKRIHITGSLLRPRTPNEKQAIADGIRQHVWHLLGIGSIEPVVSAVFPFERASDAHRFMESSQHIGKIVLMFAN